MYVRSCVSVCVPGFIVARFFIWFKNYRSARRITIRSIFTVVKWIQNSIQKTFFYYRLIHSLKAHFIFLSCSMLAKGLENHPFQNCEKMFLYFLSYSKQQLSWFTNFMANFPNYISDATEMTAGTLMWKFNHFFLVGWNSNKILFTFFPEILTNDLWQIIFRWRRTFPVFHRNSFWRSKQLKGGKIEHEKSDKWHFFQEG